MYKKKYKQHSRKMVFCYKTQIIHEEAVHNFHFIKINAEWLPSIVWVVAVAMIIKLNHCTNSFNGCFFYMIYC